MRNMRTPLNCILPTDIENERINFKMRLIPLRKKYGWETIVRHGEAIQKAYNNIVPQMMVNSLKANQF